MGHSSYVGYLAFALCFLACVSASAAAEVDERNPAPAYIIEQAKKAVVKVKQSIKEVSDNAQSNISLAKIQLKRVELLKKQAEESHSRAVEVASDNKDAAGSVSTITSTLNKVSQLHQGAKAKLEQTISSLGKFLEEAETFKGECDRELSVIKQDAEEYKDTNNEVPYLKGKARELEKNLIQILTNINDVQSTADEMENALKKAQLANLHINVIVAVATIEKMIKEVDSNIKETENKKNEVNGIVEEMNKHCTTPYADSNTIIKPLCDSAKEALTSATEAVKKANKSKENIGQQEEPADTALKHFQGGQKVSEEQNEVTKAKECVAKVKEIEDDLQTALDTANNAVINAKELQKKLLTALSTTTIAPSTEQSTETKKSDIPVLNSAGTDQKNAAIQSPITGAVQPTSKESLNQSNNSAEKLKDALIKGAQNVSTTALTGGKAAAPGVKNDSAMTVSVPLLVALIASAVLQ